MRSGGSYLLGMLGTWGPNWEICQAIAVRLSSCGVDVYNYLAKALGRSSSDDTEEKS